MALKSYEKNSFYRFFSIFIAVFLLLFLALSSLYYYKERSRLFQEEKVKNRLIYSECLHMQKILKVKQECEMPIVENIEELNNTLFEIGIAFFVTLFLILPAGYFLAMISLRPMRTSITTIDNFINGIVHDINTPLSSIKLNAQSINTYIDDVKYKEKNERILQAIKDIEALEEQLLFSLKSDKYVLKTTIFNLSKLLDDRLYFYNDIRKNTLVKFVPNNINIHADISIFTRLLDNIVLNAIKFSPHNGEVQMSIVDDVLIVKDFGKGIKNPKDVFNKYYREDTSTKGLGLGLFIVKSVADLHGIDVDIESKVGEGTRFLVELKKIKVA